MPAHETLVSIAYAQKLPLKADTEACSGAVGLHIGLSFHLHQLNPYVAPEPRSSTITYKYLNHLLMPATSM